MEVRQDQRATIESMTVKRDGDDKIVPLEEQTEFGTVLVIPMTYGDANALTGAGKLDNTKTLTEFLKKHMVEPSMSHITPEYVEKEFKGKTVNELVTAIVKASGLSDKVDVETDEDGNLVVTEKNE